MAKVFIEETTLTSIGDAIRSKTGGSELIAPLDMANEISGITTGGGGEPLVLTGSGMSAFAGSSESSNNKAGDFFVENYGNAISTSDLTSINGLFRYSKVTNIPFDINCKNNSDINCAFAFQGCQNLITIPKINGITKVSTINKMFNSCYRLRYIPDDLFKDCTFTGVDYSSIFTACSSLRKLPQWLISNFNKSTNYSYSIYYSGFSSCYVLDEILDLKPCGSFTSNTFNNTFYRCCRLKNITFKLQEDNTPYVANWKSQTIDLSSYVGYANNKTYILDYNSGITADKEVIDDATYNALKNDADWFTAKEEYCRYNHDSAVATINSLPDTSAYLATAGGTNTIKFNGDSGSLTDGGAINTLTEEEIAVATAKGWTVTLV